MLLLVARQGFEPRLHAFKGRRPTIRRPGNIDRHPLNLLPLPRHVKNDELEGKLLYRRHAHLVESAEQGAKKL